jgi:hypothetical protein
MAYGKVRLSVADRSFICEILDRRAAALPTRQAHAQSEKERRFYADAIADYQQMSLKLQGRTVGKTSFSEEELRTLRGALFGSEKPEVAEAYRKACTAGDLPAKENLMTRWRMLETLDAPLAKPFVLDRSQDAEQDEDDGDEGGNGDAAEEDANSD